MTEPTVCIAHGTFVPCRRDGEHRTTGNPYWVKAVRDYQGSSVGGLTWEPAWENDTPAPTVREGGDVAAVLAGHEGYVWQRSVGGWTCRCDEPLTAPGQPARQWDAEGPWRTHLANLLELLIAEREAKAWDEGWWKGQNDHDPTVLGYADNPYRAALTPGPHDFDNHGPTDNPDCPGCVAPETREDT